MIGKITVPFRILVLCLYLFLLGPMLIVVPLSFSNDSYLVFPPQSWGVRWYAAMFSHDRLLQAFRVSLTIAAVVTVLSLAVGVPAAYALRRWRFPGRDAAEPVHRAVAAAVHRAGLAILLVFANAGLLGTYAGLVAAHLVVTTPYVMRIMTTAFATLPPSVEEAAAMLGAPPLTVFRRVTLRCWRRVSSPAPRCRS